MPPPPAGFGAPQYPPAYVPGQPYVQRVSRIGYILLGIFLGCFGVHNFYAGYKGRAITQLLITLLTLFIASPVIFIWVIVEICTVNVDARGVPFE